MKIKKLKNETQKLETWNQNGNTEDQNLENWTSKLENWKVHSMYANAIANVVAGETNTINALVGEQV